MTLPSQPPDSGLPAADAASAALSRQLFEHLRQTIDNAGGIIPFDQYMEQALYLPGLGYYCNGARKFGSTGDFVTAPEVSPLFGRCLARAFVPLLEALDGGDLLELGAGSGVLAVDILSELEALGRLPARYLILDRSGELQLRQRQRFEQQIAHLLPRISWLERLPERPLQGIIFGNEVADALAVKRFRWQDGATVELGVTVADERLVMADMPIADAQLVNFVEEQAQNNQWQTAYESEWCPAMPAWLRSLADSLQRGALLLIDYGYGRAEYYHPQRSGGTLMCHYRHHVHADALFLPGLQDITAYVDFSTMADTADKAGMRLLGYTSQAHFLLDNGLEAMLAEQNPADQVAFFRRVSEIKTLTLPGEMGERFKVIAFGQRCGSTLDGFTIKDLRSRL